MGAFFAIVLSLIAIFLILLVLVQRGRGGGLAGALGGMGGSSAFGAKAGDVFTRITIITASIWIAICLAAVFWAKHSGDAFSTAGPASSSAPLDMPSQGPRQGGAAPRTGEAQPQAEAPIQTNDNPGNTAAPAATGRAADAPSSPVENP